MECLIILYLQCYTYNQKVSGIMLQFVVRYFITTLISHYSIEQESFSCVIIDICTTIKRFFHKIICQLPVKVSWEIFILLYVINKCKGI